MYNFANAIVLCMLLLFTCDVAVCDDFYQLLNITKGAGQREIRKAFKKLALVTHPDKNQDDPAAHEKFLKINRAYEVLKDDELRKKYDMYGEEGLKDDFHNRGFRKYQSWQFYKDDFGIYDDDPEIITLSQSDFAQSVEGSSDIWFINFYSPQCSHCHELAPVWREVARDLEGVIRIGAVNCQDDRMLCNMQGIRGYPSLVMFPPKEKYYGDRTKDALVAHAMKNVKSKAFEIWGGNFASMIDDDDNDLPWVLTLCGSGGDCLSDSSSQKLAAMLEDLVNVGMIDCHSDEDLCDKLGHEHGTYFYQTKDMQRGHGLEIPSLVVREVAMTILQQLPDVTVLDGPGFEDIIEQVRKRRKPWLIHFIEEEVTDLELRKLPVMLSHMNVGRVNCQFLRSKCNEFHIHKFPSVVIFKPTGGHEVHYGRMTAHDIAAFARDSAVTPLEALGPDDFPERVMHSNDPWFVDYFAPWCPPCMKLLPVFRKVAKNVGNKVKFGTVDCTIHVNLCRTYGIRSYPTTIFYNHTIPHQYHGQHSVNTIVEFIQDTMVPPVIILTPSTFDSFINHKHADEVWLVDFYAPWCGPCRQLAPEWRRMSKMLKNTKNIFVGTVDCDEYKLLCQTQEVRNYPTMRLYPAGSTNAKTYQPYQGWYRDAQSLRAWAFEFLPSKVQILNTKNFKENVLQSEKPWIVDFFAPWCAHCQVFKPEFEKVAENLDGIAKAGKVDCDNEPYVCEMAGVKVYPSVRYYPGTMTAGTEQDPYGQDVQSQKSAAIVQFVKDNIKPKTPPKIVHDEH